jgi:hypothetical protein
MKCNCVLCGKFISIIKALIPSQCLNENGFNAHRICKKCWFSKFALENISHKCPGCLKNKPLNINKKITEIINVEL